MQDSASAEEVDLLLQYVVTEKDPQLWEALVQEITADREVLPAADSSTWQPFVHSLVQQAKVQEAQSALLPGTGKLRPLFPIKRWGWVAAAVLLLAVAGTYWLTRPFVTQQQPIVQQAIDVQPGKQGAILTLADGSQVSLDSLQNGVVALQGGVQARLQNGQLLYEGTSQELAYNTTATPKGRHFQLSLPDGTKVWLNAASWIRYPLQFEGKERVVTISGEAYFEVVKDSRFFIVQAALGSSIKVLGTHFNVNSYVNEQAVTTTLLEGSVSVRKGTEERSIRPGEQARVTGTIELNKQADLDKTMAWKNGIFNFEGASLEEAMRQLERWYDIQVRYEGGVPNVRFFGKMSRKVNLSTVLTALKGFGLNYRMEGNTLIVTQ